jgi:hypothetical protein
VLWISCAASRPARWRVKSSSNEERKAAVLQEQREKGQAIRLNWAAVRDTLREREREAIGRRNMARVELDDAIEAGDIPRAREAAVDVMVCDRVAELAVKAREDHEAGEPR